MQGAEQSCGSSTEQDQELLSVSACQGSELCGAAGATAAQISAFKKPRPQGPSEDLNLSHRDNAQALEVFIAALP